MLYHLLTHFIDEFTPLNVVRYITFRSVVAALTAMAISFICGPPIIRWLTKLGIGQTVRDDGPQSHLVKAGTPTMGGTLILVSIVVPALLWCDLTCYYTWAVLLVVAGYGALGFIDDYIKVVHHDPKGVSPRQKLVWQVVFALGAVVLVYSQPDFTTQISVPFFKSFTPDIGLIYIPFAVLVIVATSNAVNLTDGLDGLAIGPVITCAGTLALITYAVGHYEIANYLQFAQIKDAGNLAIVCSAMVGAGLGFLWFNTYPAQVFMGDVGSLSLGGALGTVAVIAKNELLLTLMGGVFVIETLSVIVQVGSFKLTGKRVFKMAPIHHHFELKGWAEPKVIVRFWIISIILALMSLATLKLR
ncbi:MAG: phospho-N-acetylmuramoyl-pentapeptide-transferase [Candidatus Alcyoniella australis]|nr:phospho-N-acetylmuramoyl-pentapeptide-transferase [Candidatus Alcyoniella australis]